MLIAAFAAFALSAGFTVTGALLAPPPASFAYAYAPAAYPAPVYPAPTPDMPIMPRVASPPLMPAAAPPPMACPNPLRHARRAHVHALAVSTVEQIAQSLRHAGEAGRRVTVIGATRNVGTTYAAIALSRTLAKDANVVLVDLAFGAPNLSIISTDPKAPGIAELVRGTASFGDVITRDQYSPVHLVSTGHVGNDARGARRLADAGDGGRSAGAQLRSRGDRRRRRLRNRGRTVCAARQPRGAGGRRPGQSGARAPRATACRWRALPT